MFLVCEYKPPVIAFAEFTNLLLWKLRLLNINNKNNLEIKPINLEVSFEEPKKINPHDELEEANIVLDVED